jgi:hypothetical protein
MKYLFQILIRKIKTHIILVRISLILFSLSIIIFLSFHKPDFIIDAFISSKKNSYSEIQFVNGKVCLGLIFDSNKDYFNVKNLYCFLDDEKKKLVYERDIEKSGKQIDLKDVVAVKKAQKKALLAIQSYEQKRYK